jgi:hypothetical protein
VEDIKNKWNRARLKSIDVSEREKLLIEIADKIKGRLLQVVPLSFYRIFLMNYAGYSSSRCIEDCPNPVSIRIEKIKIMPARGAWSKSF